MALTIPMVNVSMILFLTDWFRDSRDKS